MPDRHEPQTEPDVTIRGPQRDGTQHADRPLTSRPLIDREVPLPGIGGTSAGTDLIHQWLDGEATESDARRADARQVEFWKRVDADADRLRRMRTPVHVSVAIMEALSPVAGAAELAVGASANRDAGVHRATGMTLGQVAFVSAIMLAIGIVVGRMI